MKWRTPKIPLPPKPPAANKHAEERLKLAASGLQAIAIALLAAALIAPLFTSSLAAPLWTRAAAVVIAFIAEGAAFEALRYIPTQVGP